MLLGYGPIDERHVEFVEVVSALQSSAESDLPERLAAVANHLQAHFDEEERWMRETQFPAHECHADEHAAELANEAAIGDTYNEEVGNELRATIEAAPSIDGCVTGAFLMRLRKLQ